MSRVCGVRGIWFAYYGIGGTWGVWAMRCADYGVCGVWGVWLGVCGA